LATLPDVIERQELANQLNRLLQETRKKDEKGTARRVRVLATAPDLAPPIGEGFAVEILSALVPVADGANEVLEQANLLEKGLFLAAHFNQSQYLKAFVARFQSLLQHQHGTAGLQTIDSLTGKCFRGLRKLGLHEEIAHLLRQMDETVRKGQPLDSLRERPDWPTLLRTLLHVASGWLYFGNDPQAKPFIDEARTLLFKGKLQYREPTRLACTYVSTLGQAPMEVALRGIDELFQNLVGIHDPFTTNSHYSLSQLE